MTAASKGARRRRGVILGCSFEAVDEARDAVGDFVARYNAEWRVVKNALPPVRCDQTSREARPRSTIRCPERRGRYSFAALALVLGTVWWLKQSHASDGAVAGGAAGALVASMVGLVVLSGQFRSMRPVRFVVIAEGGGLVIADAVGQRLGDTREGSLTAQRAMWVDHVRNRYVNRPAVILALRGHPVGGVVLGSRAIDAKLPQLSPALCVERTLDEAMFRACDLAARG